jgi:DNA-binding phage protein
MVLITVLASGDRGNQLNDIQATVQLARNFKEDESCRYKQQSPILVTVLKVISAIGIKLSTCAKEAAEAA